MNVVVHLGKGSGLTFKIHQVGAEIVQQMEMKFIIKIQNREIMKNMFLILSIFFFITGCSEEEIKQQESSIYGTWQLTEEYIVSGVNGNWIEIQNGYTFSIESNNVFSSTEFQECAQGIVVISDTQIVFKYECEGFTIGIEFPEGEFSYKYSFVGNKLSLNPNFMNCDEGCGYRFTRISEN